MANIGKGTITDFNESQQPEGLIPVFLIETSSDIEGFLMCMNWPSGQKGDPVDIVGKQVSFDLTHIKSKLVANPWYFDDGTGIGPAKVMTVAGRAVKAQDSLKK